MPDPTSDARQKAVDAAREAWIRRLVDTSRRNNLLYFRDLAVGTLDFSAAREGAVDELLMGAKVPLSMLVPDDPKAAAKLQEIVRKARSNREERGLETLYLAYGMATWPVDDGGRPPEAAAVLVPLAVEGKAAPTLVRAGPPRPNLALLHVLSDLGFAPELDEESEDAAAMLGRLQATVALPDFSVRPRAVVGNFSFQKLAMVRDLQEAGAALAAHDLVAALAGDPSARAEVARRRVAVEPRTLDAVPPDDEFMPLDADSSQQAVVHAVARGSDGVVQGPPGCGKSQTIANLVATLVAEGKRVLFVAEKRAALEAVLKRLEACGLAHLALDLHGATVSQKTVVARIGETLASIREAAEPNEEEIHSRFVDRRGRMVAHDRMMHTPLAPSGMSAFELQAAMLASTLASRTRWRAADLARLTPDVVTRVEDLLEEAAGHADLFLGRGLWAGAELENGHSAQTAIDAVAILTERLPEMRRALARLADALGITPPKALEDIRALLNLVEATDHVFAGYLPAILDEAADLLSALSPLEEGFFGNVRATLFDARFRKGKRRLRELARVSDLDPHGLQQAATVAHAWRERGVQGRAVEWKDSFEPFWLPLNEAVSTLKRLHPGAHLDRSVDIESLTRSLLDDAVSARALPRILEIQAELDSLGAASILHEIRSGSDHASPASSYSDTLIKKPESDPFTPLSVASSSQGRMDHRWRVLFRKAWLTSCYEAAQAQDPKLAGFKGAYHQEFVASFQEWDRQRTVLAAARVRRAHAEAAVAAMNAHPEQTDRVRAEVQKRSRHKSLRRLLTEAPDVLPAVCPCWMASPLNVSGLLPADRTLFDVVVFDEASQVLPEDAVCAVLRGRRLVVAGDRHQLPPTLFFADGADDEEESEVAGFQSLLDQMGAFLEPWPLLWHYRSRDERLIAFSNRFVYGDRLVTFPGVGGEPCVSHVLVAPSLVVPPSLEASPSEETKPDEESSSAEVQRVVQLVLDHAEADPEVSLGVIAMGLKHARRIEAALDRALDDRPELEPFFDPKRPERFFVKNLEQVQGDERDAILISVGYGKGHDGRLPYRFGPLLQEGGERRLNVAVTRARSRMTVVSSFSHLDMDPGRSKARGVILLREFLQFAASGGTNLGERAEATVPMNPFEADVYDALTARGVPLTPQHGVGGYRLDFAAAHPEQRGRFVLAIECDGASYHSAPTARDRDRLRQQQLEAIGWRFHRIWSTDWTLHREREVESAVRAWQAAIDPTPAPSQAEGLDVVAPPLRATPPTVVHRDDVEDVPALELDALVRWAVADGVRTDDEIVDEVSERLGYARVGAKIDRTIRAALGRVKRAP